MKEITTNNNIILFAPIEDDIIAYSVHHAMDMRLRSLRVSSSSENYEAHLLPMGDYQILGKSTELSEEQMKEIITLYEGKKYKVYTGSYGKYTDKVQESYLSLLEANGIVDRNSASHPSDIDPTNRSHYDKIEQEWQQAQSKVKHYLVLKRI